MKKKSMKLADLKVKSFDTSLRTKKGGTGPGPYESIYICGFTIYYTICFGGNVCELRDPGTDF